MQSDIANQRDALAALCRRFGVTRLEVFGSAARGVGFDPKRSDADLLVTFAPATRNDLTAFADLKDALGGTTWTSRRPCRATGRRRESEFHPPAGDSERGRNRLWLNCPNGIRLCYSICCRVWFAAVEMIRIGLCDERCTFRLMCRCWRSTKNWVGRLGWPSWRGQHSRGSSGSTFQLSACREASRPWLRGSDLDTGAGGPSSDHR